MKTKSEKNIRTKAPLKSQSVNKGEDENTTTSPGGKKKGFAQLDKKKVKKLANRGQRSKGI